MYGHVSTGFFGLFLGYHVTKEHEGHLMQLKSSVANRAPKASRRRDSREAREVGDVDVTKVSPADVA